MVQQSVKQKIGKVGGVFTVSALIVALFVLWGVLFPSSLRNATDVGLAWMIKNFGWFYMLITALFIFFVIAIAFSPYGKIRLGKENDQPSYSLPTWIGMIFAAGIGVGFVFWGVAEPVLYYMEPPFGYQPGTNESAIAGLRYGAYHWALHPWSIYALVGMTLAFVQYRKGLPALISSAFYPVLGDRVYGWIGKTIDILAVIATCTGVATTFGMSAMQITGGLSHISSIPKTPFTQLIIISIVTVLFLFSAARGLDRGIKVLSNINLIIAGFLLLFVIVTGPTLFIAESFVTTLGGYIANVIPMAFTLTPFSDSEWLGKNTIFFWAWHISWAPFMGWFIARISRGRTIREFVAGVLIVPTLIAILWFTTFGGTGLYIELFGNGGLYELIHSHVELALFSMLAELPFSAFMNVLAIVLIGIFFVTSADSASFVLASLTSNGTLNPSLNVKIVWGLLIAGSASVLLLSGGGGLQALQTASIIAALPFAIILVFMAICIVVVLAKERKEEIYDRVSREVYMEMKEDLYDSVKKEVYNDVKEKMYDEMKDELYDDVIDKVHDDMKDDMKKEILDEIHEEQQPKKTKDE